MKNTSPTKAKTNTKGMAVYQNRNRQLNKWYFVKKNQIFLPSILLECTQFATFRVVI